MVPVAGRLAVVAAGGPAVGLLGFLFGPGVAEAGRLGLVADRGLAFVAAGFVDGVDVAGFTFFQKAKSSIKPKKKNKNTTTNNKNKKKRIVNQNIELQEHKNAVLNESNKQNN